LPATMIKLDFKEPTVNDAKWAAPMLKNAGMTMCEFSYTTIWMWRKYYMNQIARLGSTLFVRSGDVEPLYLLPVGGELRQNIELLREFQHQNGESLTLFGADTATAEQIDDWFPGVFEWHPSKGDFDYIYRTEDLSLLKGRKYHSKRNHISSFNAKYNWSYERINDNNSSEVFDMVLQWCKEKSNCSDPVLRSERQSIKEALNHMDKLSLIGGLLRVDGKVVAMTMGSPISDEMFDIHTEKALIDYAGAYAVINREFALRELYGKYSYINRENDMGIEGLRRAKRSYRPVELIEKYVGTEKEMGQ
jgi:hypothetical protein